VLERTVHAVVLGEGALERGEGDVEISFDGGQEATATGRRGERPGAGRALGSFLALLEVGACALELSDADRRFDRVRPGEVRGLVPTV
jgi:hypothetical protein